LPSPEPVGRTESAEPCRHDPPSSLAVGWSLEESPSSCRRMGSAIPPRGSSTSWSSGDGREPFDRLVSPSADFTPASEFHPVRRDAVLRRQRLSRGLLPLQRHPERTSHRSRSCLLRVLLRPCRSRRLRRLAPVRTSPACFIRARSWGSSLQSMTRKDRRRLPAGHPLLRLALRRHATRTTSTVLAVLVSPAPCRSFAFRLGGGRAFAGNPFAFPASSGSWTARR